MVAKLHQGIDKVSLRWPKISALGPPVRWAARARNDLPRGVCISCCGGWWGRFGVGIRNVDRIGAEAKPLIAPRSGGGQGSRFSARIYCVYYQQIGSHRVMQMHKIGKSAGSGVLECQTPDSRLQTTNKFVSRLGSQTPDSRLPC